METRNRAATAQCPGSMPRQRALALVWAVNDDLEAEALENLRGGLWPGRHLYEIAQVRCVPQGVPCPLRRDDPAVLEYELRDGWTWVLVLSSRNSADADREAQG